MKFNKFERKMAELALDMQELEHAKVKPDNDYEKIMMQLYEDEIIGYLKSIKNTIRDVHKSPVYCGIVKRCNDGYYVGSHKLDKFESIQFCSYITLDDQKEGFDEERVLDDDFLKSIGIDAKRYNNDSPADRYVNIINAVDPEEYLVNARIGHVESDFTIRADCELFQRDLNGVLVLVRR